jgi:hypothetical protein
MGTPRPTPQIGLLGERQIASLNNGHEILRVERVLRNLVGPLVPPDLVKTVCLARFSPCKLIPTSASESFCQQLPQAQRVSPSDLRPENGVNRVYGDLVTERLGLTSILPIEPAAGLRVIKLHGSIDWYCVDGIVQRERLGEAPPFIATPGPTNLESTRDDGPLGQLWVIAQSHRLWSNAEEFLGFALRIAIKARESVGGNLYPMPDVL